ncbi:MAG: CC0125/CC1285 family lipoprotein [Rubrivivax sp.]
MFLRHVLVFSVVGIGALVSACSTPYKEYGPMGGYLDKGLGGGKFMIKFVGNGFTSPETVKQHWNRRAAELCQGKEYEAEARAGIELQRGIIVNSSGAFQNTERFPMMEGTVQCKQ